MDLVSKCFLSKHVFESDCTATKLKKYNLITVQSTFLFRSAFFQHQFWLSIPCNSQFSEIKWVLPAPYW